MEMAENLVECVSNWDEETDLVYRRKGKRENEANKSGENESLKTYIRKKNLKEDKAHNNGRPNKKKGDAKVAKKSKSNAKEEKKTAKNKQGDEENGEVSGNKTEEKKSKLKKKREIGEEEEDDDKTESALYLFPHNRIHRIIKTENPDTRMSQEAIFVLNKATEKFLEVFCREAYACAFMDRNNYVGYDHLSPVVSKRQKFDFLSDFVPQKVRAEDALSEISKAEET